ncbi:MAG TPA: SiaB family protein kinase [Bacteroidales bacterium]|nr:SiaB family protein kinase [Bacteroidales bacterium]
MEGTTLISYQGSIRYETIGELIHNFKQQVPLLGIPMGTYKRILLVMIESLENIMKHSVSLEPPMDGNLPDLSIIHQDNKYIIETSNPISSADITNLKTRIDLLNNMDQQGLKSLYKETITDGVFTKRGGAGLGLIEIAKISCNPIQYEFEAINKDYTRYRQLVTVSAK